MLWRAICTGLLLILSITVASADLFDHFDNGVVDSWWIVETGTWSESGTFITQTTSGLGHIYNSTQYSSVTVISKFYINSSTYSAGITFYNLTNKYGNIIYINLNLGGLYIGDISNGSFVTGTAVALATGLPTASGPWFLKVVINSGNATVYLVDPNGATYTNTTSLDYSVGGIGLIAAGEAQAHFDYIDIYTTAPYPLQSIKSISQHQLLSLVSIEVQLNDTGSIRLDLSTDSSFTWLNYTEWQNDTYYALFYELPLKDNTTYYYRVASHNVFGDLIDTTTGYFTTGRKVSSKNVSINPLIQYAIRPSITYVPMIGKYVMGYQPTDTTGYPLDNLRITISDDGITWTNDSLFVSATGVRGQGDMVYENGTLYYFYWVVNDGIKVASCSGDCLTAKNVTNSSYWVFHGTVIPYNQVPWTSKHVYAAGILKDLDMNVMKTSKGEYVVYVTGWDTATPTECTLGFYTTTDLTNATAYGNATAILSSTGKYGDPLLAPVSGKSDDAAATVSNVFYYNGYYYLLYQGWDGTYAGSVSRTHEKIMIMKSDKWWGDFKRLGVVADTDTWYDELAAANPNYVRAGNEFRIYYYGVNDSGTYGYDTIDYVVLNNIIDTVPPPPVSNLQNTTGITWIKWTWDNPTVVDFDHVEVWIDGVFTTNTTSGFYNLTGISTGEPHTISLRVVDTSGLKSEWVNDTTTTYALPPIIVNVWNNITKDSSRLITVVASKKIEFGVVASQNITTWCWTNVDVYTGDGTISSNATKLFDTTGDFKVFVYGENANGTTQTIIWRIFVNPASRTSDLVICPNNTATYIPDVSNLIPVAVKPLNDCVTVTITEYNTTSGNVTLLLRSTNHTNIVWINASVGKPNTEYNVIKNGTKIDNVTTDSDGIFRYKYTGGFTTVKLSFIPVIYPYVPPSGGAGAATQPTPEYIPTTPQEVVIFAPPEGINWVMVIPLIFLVLAIIAMLAYILRRR